MVNGIKCFLEINCKNIAWDVIPRTNIKDIGNEPDTFSNIPTFDVSTLVVGDDRRKDRKKTASQGF